MKSDEHWTSHSVPGIRSQQIAVQSPLVTVATVRFSKAASVVGVTVGVDIDVVGIDVTESPPHSKPQSISPSSSLTRQTALQSPLVVETTVR